MAPAARDGGFKANADAAQAAATLTPHHQRLGVCREPQWPAIRINHPHSNRKSMLFLCLSAKTVMERKRNDRNSAATSSFCHRVGTAHGELSTAQGSGANVPGAP